MTDPTVLSEAAESVLTALLVGAEDAGWDVTGCVTVGEPSVDCDKILVWVAGITPIQTGKCIVASRVRFNFFIASCIGASLKESCEWWDQRSGSHLDRVWAVWIALVEAVLSDSLCVGVTCADVTLGELRPVPAADVGLWQGSVEIVLSPRVGS